MIPITVFGVLFPVWLAIALLVLLIMMFVSVEQEKPMTSTACTIAAVWALNYFNIVNVHTWSFFSILMWSAIYLAVGLLWSFIRWNFWLKNWTEESKQRIKEQKGSFLRTHSKFDSEVIPPELKEEWLKFASRHDGYRSFTSPDVMQNKSRILLWAVYWPFSMCWTIIDEPIMKFFRWILFTVLGGAFQKVSNTAISEIKRELGED